MQIISHRGYWKTVTEKNKTIAFERSFSMGFGTETDLRDICGKIVISHDTPCGDEILFEDLLQIMNGRNLPLALNIKCDGLSKTIKNLLDKYHHTNYFTFDMSIPDMLNQIENNLIVFTGQSDILKHPVLLQQAKGVWLDSFFLDWFTAKDIDDLIAIGKKVCIVSADLHNRSIIHQWKIIKQSCNLKSDALMLCSNEPEFAKDFFYGKD